MITYSIIQKSQLEGALRLDAEYYQPEYLDLEKKLNNLETKTIEEISKSVISFGAYSLTSFIQWQDEGVLYINVGDIYDGYVDLSDVKYISEGVDEILKKSRVSEGQVLLTMAGTIGNAAVAHNFPKKVNANQAIAKITPKDISPYYLAAFLNSRYGLLQTQREIVSSVQANIFLGPIKKIRVPVFDKQTRKSVEDSYKRFLDTLEDARACYSQAEDLLLEELGLKDFKVEEDLTWTENFSEIKEASRLDAEYFQPKYDELLSKLKNKKKFKELAERKSTILKISSEIDYKYIEISDIKVSSGEPGFNLIKGRELPANGKMKIDGGELIISKVRPTRGAVAIVPEEWNKNFVGSGAFSIFEVESPMREYLQVALRSVVGKLQLEKPTTGTSYPTVTDEDIENIFIPILDKSNQQKIADLVRQSHEARKKAKQLLEEAKQKVEELIEKGK